MNGWYDVGASAITTAAATPYPAAKSAGDGLRRLKLRLRLDELAGARQCAIQLALGRHARLASLIH
jgi:hypothetical protein